MKLSNFILIDTKAVLGSCSIVLNKIFTAEVDVTTGFLWFKKTNRRKVARELGGYWYFCDTGKYTPMYKIEELARSYTARTGTPT